MNEDSSKGGDVFGSDKGRAGLFPRFILNSLTLRSTTFRLIPSDLTAIEVGLSHASRTTRTMSGSGVLLSNTLLTYP